MCLSIQMGLWPCYKSYLGKFSISVEVPCTIDLDSLDRRTPPAYKNSLFNYVTNIIFKFDRVLKK